MAIATDLFEPNSLSGSVKNLDKDMYIHPLELVLPFLFQALVPVGIIDQTLLNLILIMLSVCQNGLYREVSAFGQQKK